MNERRVLRWWLIAIAVVTVWLLTRDGAAPDPYAGQAANPTRLLVGDGRGFARARGPRPFSFPADHGPHPAYRTEWWYFTGHLATPEQRPFGFQLTLFRFEIAPNAVPSPSAWRTPRVLLGHFALSDVANRRFHAFERLARAHPAIGGVSASPPAIRLDEWHIERVPGVEERWRLHGAQGEVALTLELEAQSPVVLQGEAGYSRKSAEPGNASYYYSIPRLAAAGELRLGEARWPVAGSAWLDREWSTSALARTQQGWDWFALQLDDGAHLMYYRLRDSDGRTDPHSAGSYLAPDGAQITLGADDVRLAVTRWWRSPDTGTRYPVAWRVDCARLDLVLSVEPLFDAQEWQGQFPYWEGAVAVSGARSGRGYVELTGY